MKTVAHVSCFLALLLSCIPICQATHNPQQIFYVVYNSTARCPVDIQIKRCQTFDWYVEHIDISFTSNTIMLFEEGVYILKKVIVVDNCHDFIMSGNGSAGHSSDGLPQPTSTLKIYCEKGSSAGFFFSNSTNISIKNLELRFCSGQYRPVRSLSQRRVT